MKAPLSLVLVTAVAALGFSAHAADTGSAVIGKKKARHGIVGVVGVASRGTPAGINLLAEAYHHLETADHDYKGHRVRAMHQIETAARLLGANIHGTAKDHDVQMVSDEHLRKAESLLQEAEGDFAGKPLRHVRDAASQLTIALNVH